MTPHKSFAASMAAALEAAIAPVLVPGRPIALANFPNHNNPGDNAVWLGAKALLRRLGVPVGYSCSPVTFDEAAMRALLAPDLALALGPLRSGVTPHVPILWLGRRDPERVERPAPPSDIPFVDWVQAAADADFSPSARALLAENQRLLQAAAAGDAAARARTAATFDGLARAWLARGLDILRSARVVITDRLHAHELATLLGIPHVVLDNANGKVRSIFEAWTGRSGLAHWAETSDEAVAIARRLLDTAGSREPARRQSAGHSQ